MASPTGTWRTNWTRARAVLRRYDEIAWWGFAAGTTFGLILVASQTEIIGKDWRIYYRPATLSGDFVNYDGVANPAHILFLFYPLAWLHPLAGYFVLMGLTFVAFRVAAKLGSFNKWVFALSYPAWWMLVYGQIDGLVMAGVALGAWSLRRRRPYVVGLAVLLLWLKPHIGGILGLVYLLWAKDWRPWAVVTAIGLAALVFNSRWPAEWMVHVYVEFTSAVAKEGFSDAIGRISTVAIFPYGMLLWLLVLLPYPRQQKILAIIGASLLSSPYAPGYSTLLTMGLRLPRYLYPLFVLPFFGYVGHRLLIVEPLFLVIWPVAEHYVLPFVKSRRVAYSTKSPG